MKFDLNTLSPWADFHKIMTNAKSLTVKCGNRKLGPEMDLSVDDEGNVTMAFTNGKKK